MDPLLSPLIIALPEVMLLIFLSLVLCVDVLISEKRRYFSYVLTIISLIAVTLVVIWQLSVFSLNLTTFNFQYRLDKLALTSKLFIYLFSLASFIYSYRYIAARNIARGDYYLLGLSAVLGMSVMASANSLLTIFLGLELLSLPLYGMTAIYRESEMATEAAMKYFILGSLASGFLLYGMSLLYGVTGSLQIDAIHISLSAHLDALTLIALIFILAGLIFKFGAVPFHMWVPDLYHGAPTTVTLFIASAPKIAAFVITIRMLAQALPTVAFVWTPLLIGVSILSMGLGNILAIAQSNVKRMLAYSSIAHIGYTLLGILVGPLVPEGYSAALFYIVTYALIAAGGFGVIALMSQQGIELDHMNDYKGLNQRHPWLAFMMLLLLFSMAGIPPTVGFFAKLGLLNVLIQGDMTWLAIVSLVFAIIGAYYYLRLVKYMYFDEPAEDVRHAPIILSKDMTALISVNGLLALLFGILPNYLLELCRFTLNAY